MAKKSSKRGGHAVQTSQTKMIALLIVVFIVAVIIMVLRAGLAGVTWSFWARVPSSRPLTDVHPWDYIAMAISIIIVCAILWYYRAKKKA